jgi:2-amino-4-hydroxy-6-hydroxymethyldihydropteridine diphosphokinase
VSAAGRAAIEAFVAVGSNIDPRANILAAAGMLARQMPLTGASTFWRTESIGPDGEPDGQAEYLNGVFRVAARGDARTMKYGILREIERRLGRVRQGPAGRFAARTIDLDLVIFGAEVIDEPDLRIPAPDVARPFVAAGLIELAPDLVLPHTRQPLACLWPGGAAAAGLTPDEELTGQLKELCLK